MKLGPALTDDDSACVNDLTTENFDAETFGYAIATILDATLSFFMCHKACVFFCVGLRIKR